MKTKKWALTLILTGIITAFAIPCVAQNQKNTLSEAAIEYVTSEKEEYPFLNGKTGTAIFDRWAEEELKDMTNTSCDCSVENFIFSDSITSALAMIKSGRADFMLTTDITANYIAQRNHDIKSINTPGTLEIVMSMRSADTSLKDSFNAAIKALKETGKLAELENKWIKELPAGQEPAMAGIEKVSDTAETIYIGVSGDMPPLDYIAADGKPAGYNIALLAEISKLTGKNIEIVSMNSQARFTALESKKIDVFFWMVFAADPFVKEQMKQNPNEQLINKKFIFTDPHCVVKTGFILKK